MYRIKVSKKGVIYLPVGVRRILNVINGGEVLLTIKSKDEITIKRIKSPFTLGAEKEKITKITIEEFERESEEMQDKLYQKT